MTNPSWNERIFDALEFYKSSISEKHLLETEAAFAYSFLNNLAIIQELVPEDSIPVPLLPRWVCETAFEITSVPFQNTAE